MRIALALAVFAAAASPAAAQCITIGDGAGNAAIHCQDGRVGHMQGLPGGGVAGMLGGQVFSGSAAQVVPPSLGAPQPLTGYLNPDIAARTAPVPPPSLAAPSPELEPLSPWSLSTKAETDLGVGTSPAPDQP